MLVIWTNAKTDALKKVIAPVIEKQAVEHQVRSVPDLNEAELPSIAKGDVVLACGGDAFAILKSLGLFQKSLSMGYMRETPLTVGEAKYLITYDPGVVYRDYARMPEIQWDAALAVRLHNTGSTAPVLGDYQFSEDFNEIVEEIEANWEATQKPLVIACDLETMGLDEYSEQAQIVSITLTAKDGVSRCLYLKPGEVPQQEEEPWECGLWDQINWILTTDKVKTVGANFKFDSRWLNRKWKINCTNCTFDTLIVGSLLDENRSNNLKLHAKLFTPLGGYDDALQDGEIEHMESVPKERFIIYAGGDTDATHKVYHKFRKDLLSDSRLTNFYVKIAHPSTKVFEKVERTGILVDLPYTLGLQTELEVEVKRLEKAMFSMMPNKIKIKYEDNLSITRPVILREFLFSDRGLGLEPKVLTAGGKDGTKEKQPSCAEDHLMMFEDHPVAQEFIKLYSEYQSASKTLSTFVVGFLKHLRSDSRFHPHYMLHRGAYGSDEKESGTVTGRCLTGDALILTDKGELPIEELVIRGEGGEPFKVLTHKNRWLPVTGFYRNGLKSVCRVSTATTYLTTTLNHPFMSFPSWTEAGALEVGSWLYSIVKRPLIEEWRTIQDWPFEVSNLGQVRRSTDSKRGAKAGDLVAQRAKGRWGHKKVTLTRFTNGREKKDFPVHSLVAVAFCIGLGDEIAHLNGDAGCNWSTNLLRCSSEENKLHMRLHGTANHDNQKKLSWESVGDIRSGNLGEDSEAASALGVSLKLVNDVRLGKRWNGRRDSMRGFHAVKVFSVEAAGTQETFDLSVEGDHSFVANGLVVHNTSAKDPAVQTISKHTKWSKRLRRMYVAPPGYVILQLDFSQGELRIVACVANETTMLKAYREGKDLHIVTAAGVNHIEYDDFKKRYDAGDPDLAEMRSGAKPGNFGLLYGMQAGGFVNYARKNYGITMPLTAAIEFRDGWFDLYSEIEGWHNRSISIALKHGHIRSPLGRIRHLPLIYSKDYDVRGGAERMAINSPIQSCLSDMMQYAMVLIDREYGHEDIHPFLMTHDSIALYVPEGRHVEWAQRIKAIMDNLPLKKEFGWDHQIPFPADAEYSAPDEQGVMSLSSLKKLS